jgi:hypothetical protein
MDSLIGLTPIEKKVLGKCEKRGRFKKDGNEYPGKRVVRYRVEYLAELKRTQPVPVKYPFRGPLR